MFLSFICDCIFAGSENSDTTSCPESLGEEANMKDLIMINKGMIYNKVRAQDPPQDT